MAQHIFPFLSELQNNEDNEVAFVASSARDISARAQPSAFGFRLAALGNQSSALVGKGLKHRGSDIAFFRT